MWIEIDEEKVKNMKDINEAIKVKKWKPQSMLGCSSTQWKKNDEERSQTDKTKMREKKFNIILQGDVIFIKNFKGIKKLFIRVY